LIENYKSQHLEKIIDIEEIYFLIELYPRTTYLKMNRINNMDMELFIGVTLMKMKTKYNHHLRLLCFGVSATGEEIIHKLEKIINVQKLFIKSELDNMYVQ
jgi:predicted transcriptional regulator with HTH domain